MGAPSLNCWSVPSMPPFVVSNHFTDLRARKLLRVLPPRCRNVHCWWMTEGFGCPWSKGGLTACKPGSWRASAGTFSRTTDLSNTSLWAGPSPSSPFWGSVLLTACLEIHYQLQSSLADKHFLCITGSNVASCLPLSVSWSKGMFCLLGFFCKWLEWVCQQISLQ